jgi:ankyrin repeat protein
VHANYLAKPAGRHTVCCLGAGVVCCWSQPSSSQATALLLAAKHNSAAVVQHLATQCGCSCSQADSSGTSPLMAAAAAAARDVVALLLQHRQQWGVQLAAKDAAGNGAVVYAARGGDAEVLQMLAAAGLPLSADWPGLTAARAGMQQNAACLAYQPCAADLASSATSTQPASMINHPARDSCLPTAASVLAGMCLDGGDALMHVAAGAGSVGVVTWLLQQGIGEQTVCRRCLQESCRHWALELVCKRRKAACGLGVWP